MDAVRRFLWAWLVLGMLAGGPAHGQAWTGTWGAAPAGPPPPARLITLTDQTLRLIVHISNGGNRVHIRLSNEMGSVPLRIGAAHIGLRASGGVVAALSDRTLTFNGLRTVTIPAGSRVDSDAVALVVPGVADLAVSLFLPGSSALTTTHESALQSGYISTAGDFTASPMMPVKATTSSWPLLAGVDVDLAAPVVVAFGDSLTDGVRSTSNANHRWTDYLTQRLRGLGRRVGIVNRGISANQLLTVEPGALWAGRPGLERYDRDVLATPGVRAAIVLIGINDISYHSPTPARLVEAYRELVARGRAQGIKVYGATMPPFESSPNYSPARETIRQTVNGWIRGSGAFDGVIDFDQSLRDPDRPSHLLASFDSGDHLHPNDAGYLRMANLVPLAFVFSANQAPGEEMAMEPAFE